MRTKGAGGSLGLRLFGALALFAVAPALVLFTLSDFALENTVATEIGKAAAGKLRVAHNVETIVDDTVKQLGMRITLDPALKALAHHRYASLLADAGTQFEFRRFLDLLDDSVRPNSLLKSVEIVFEDADYVLSSERGVSSWDQYPDRAWLAAVVNQRGFEGNGAFLAPHVLGDASPEDLVVSYYFPLPPYLTELRGAVVIHVAERAFSQLINNSTDAEGTIAVVDDQGRVVSHVQKARVGQVWDPQGTFSRPRDGEGVFTVSGPDGDHLVTWYRPDRGPWTYVGDFSLAALTRNVTTVRVLTVTLTLVLMVLGVGLAYVLANRFFHPVRRLIREVNERLGSQVAPEGRNELGLLSGAFDTLLKRETQLFRDLETQRRRRDQGWIDAVLRSEAPGSDDRPQGLSGSALVPGALVIDGYPTFEAAFPPDQREYLRSVLVHMAERAFGTATFGTAMGCLGTVYDKRTVALVLSTDLVDGGAFADLVDEAFERLGAEARRLLGTTLTLSLGARGAVEDLGRSWTCALTQVRQRFLSGPGQWFWTENPSVSDTPFFPLKGERKVLAALESRNLEGVQAALDDLGRVLTSRRGLSYDNALLILHQLVGGIAQHMVETRVDLAALFGQDGDLHRVLSEAETLHQALSWLATVCQRLVGVDQPEGHVPVMIRYIRNHLRHDFGVEEVALAAGLSYSHARRVFEGALGESIVDYANSLRIAEAKRLLVETELSLGDVAQAVGYNNTQSLHRYFKKLVGLTPGEFRTRNATVEFAEASRI